MSSIIILNINIFYLNNKTWNWLAQQYAIIAYFLEGI